MATEADILKALENLYAPGGVSLAKAVSGVNLSGAKAFVSLAGDPAKPEGWEMARVNAEKAIKALPGIDAAIVTLTAERAPARPRRTTITTAIRTPRRRRRKSAACRRRWTRSASSSPSPRARAASANRRPAANLALGLAAHGWRVGLLDADIYGPSVPRLFGLNEKPEVDGRQADPARGLWHQGHVDRLPRRRGRRR